MAASALDMEKTALVCIEFQNEFVHEKGALHGAVEGTMGSTSMLAKTIDLAAKMRAAGAKVFHVPIDFDEDHGDSPNSSFGVLNGLKKGKLFIRGSFGATICDEMTPQEGDVIIKGKRGLCGWSGTTLEEKLKEHSIENICLTGFLTNCCVESTMRNGYEKGYKVITIPDCTAATSQEGFDAAVEHTYPLFSTPMTKEEFVAAHLA